MGVGRMTRHWRLDVATADAGMTGVSGKIHYVKCAYSWGRMLFRSTQLINGTYAYDLPDRATVAPASSCAVRAVIPGDAGQSRRLALRTCGTMRACTTRPLDK
jgi:hypothetical protein